MIVRKLPYQEAVRNWVTACEQSEKAEREVMLARRNERQALGDLLQAIHTVATDDEAV